MPLTTVSQGLLSTDAQYTGFKNRIINGGMVLDQRNAGASISLSGSNAFPVDRMLCFGRASGVGVTGQRSTVAPAGFINSLLYTATTGTAPTAGDYAGINQYIEGFNIADLGWGTANAQTVTLSFWVRSSVTGTYPFSVHNSAVNRSFVSTYTVNTANTWEQKTVTIAGDTSGTWLTDNGIGMRLVWDMGYGFGTTTTTNAWQAGDFYSVSGNVKLISTAGATFYITGVQLEKGSTATSFDYRPYGTELQLCQRYGLRVEQQQNSGGTSSSTTTTQSRFPFPVTMRATPTASLITAGSWIVGNDFSLNFTASSVSILSQNLTASGGRVQLGGFTNFGSNIFVAGSDAVGTAVMFLSAEL